MDNLHPFQQSLGEVTKLLKEFRKEKNPRLKILLSNEVKNLEHTFTQLKFAEDTLSEKLSNTIEGYMREVENLLNYLPSSDSFGLIRLSLLSIHNQIRVKYSSLYLSGAMGRIYSTTIILSQILFGLTEIEELPAIPEETHPQYETYVFKTLSILQSTAAIYALAVQLTPSIRQVDLVDWFDESLRRYEYFFTIFRTINWEIISEKLARFEKVNQLLDSVIEYNNAIETMVNLVAHIYQIYGDHWPSEIEVREPLTSKNIAGVIDTIGKSIQFLYQLLDVLRYPLVEYNSRNYSTDIGTKANQHIRYTITYMQLIINKILLLESYENMEVDESMTSMFIFQAKELINAMNPANKFSGKTSFISWLKTIHILEELVPVYVIHSLNTKNFTNYYYDFADFFQIFEMNKEMFLETILYFILAKLRIGIELDPSFDLKEILELTENIAANIFPHSPLVISYTILIALIKSKLNVDPEEILPAIFELEDTHFTTGNFGHLHDEFMDYINTIRRCLKNQHPSWYQFKNRVDYKPHDHVSLLIPDFTKISETNLRPSVRYIPFNLALDRVSSR